MYSYFKREHNLLLWNLKIKWMVLKIQKTHEINNNYIAILLNYIIIIITTTTITIIIINAIRSLDTRVKAGSLNSYYGMLGEEESLDVVVC